MGYRFRGQQPQYDHGFRLWLQYMITSYSYNSWVRFTGTVHRYGCKLATVPLGYSHGATRSLVQVLSQSITGLITCWGSEAKDYSSTVNARIYTECILHKQGEIVNPNSTADLAEVYVSYVQYSCLLKYAKFNGEN